MSTTPEVITDLIGNLIYARSGWGDWAKRVKATGLPGWPWSRGDRVAQVLFEAGLTDKRPHELWRLLQKAKRHREARHRLTQEHVDYLMKRRMKEWYKSLRMLRMYGTVRAD